MGMDNQGELKQYFLQEFSRIPEKFPREVALSFTTRIHSKDYGSALSLLQMTKFLSFENRNLLTALRHCLYFRVMGAKRTQPPIPAWGGILYKTAVVDEGLSVEDTKRRQESRFFFWKSVVRLFKKAIVHSLGAVWNRIKGVSRSEEEASKISQITLIALLTEILHWENQLDEIDKIDPLKKYYEGL